MRRLNRLTILLVCYVLVSISPALLHAQVASLSATLSLSSVDGVSVPFQNGIPLPSFEKQKRAIIDLQGQWKKQRFSADHAISLAKRDAVGYQNLINEAQNRYLADFDDSSWEVKTLPAVENKMYAFPTVPEYFENGVWYRRNFTVDSDVTGKFIKLMFYSVNYVADVWVNGVYLGYHEGGYTPFAFDVSKAIKPGAVNTIAVRVDNPAWGTRNDIVPFIKADWFNYAGIIHDVYLEISDRVSVVRTNIVPQSTDGTIQTGIILSNKNTVDKSVTVSAAIYKANVTPANITTELAADLIGEAADVSGTTQTTITISKDSSRVWQPKLKINSPVLWSPKYPNLYVMKVTVQENGTILDEYYTQFGIRTVKTVVDKVQLNGKSVFLTGVARHEDHPTYGRSIPLNIIYEDLLKAKDLNANYIRTAHYPNHLYTYELADRMGFAIMEEIPVWWFDSTMCWIIQNSVRHIHEQMFREMVFKDYNRPSILFWSTCNECLDVPNRKTYIARVKQDLTFNYADGRLITESAAADRPGPNDDSQSATDVCGWTMYFGIFHGGTCYESTRLFLGNANLNFSEKPIMDTEYGYWSYESNNQNGQNAQDTVFTKTFAAFTYRASVLKPDGSYRDGGYLAGITWWALFDWYSAQHPTGFQSMGLYKMLRDSLKKAGNSLKAAYAPFYNVGGVSNVDEKLNGGKPDNYKLLQNYPNPFNPETKIEYVLPKNEYVSLKIYNVVGKEVAKLLGEQKQAGTYAAVFDAAKMNLASGIYFYRLTAGDFTSSRKMVYLK